MAEAGLWLAACVGVFSLWRRNLTALPLLLSFGLASALCWQEVRFDPRLWMLIDIAVIIAIVKWCEIRLSEKLIIALFAVAAVAYWLPEGPRYWISWAVVVLQFLLTAPWLQAWHRTRLVNRDFNPWSHLDLRQMCS